MSRRKPKIQRRQPLQARAQATYEAALEATARIIRREGLARLNTNRIAEVTGISVGTLYGYFPDKTAIVVALARRLLANDRTALLAALRQDGDPIRNIVRALIARHRDDPQVRRAVMSVHIGEGHGGEHGVAAFLPHLADTPTLSPTESLRLFVAARAAVGVARSLVEEPEASRFSDQQLEDEIMRLLAGYLSPAAMRSLVSPGAAQTSS